MTTPVLKSLLKCLQIKPNPSLENSKDEEFALPTELIDARVISRFINARLRNGLDPKYTYIMDVDITKGNARDFKFVHQMVGWSD